MSQSLHRPLLSVVGLSSAFERRWFSQATRRCAPKGQAQFSRPAQPPDRSLRIAAKEMMAMPSDLGLLEATFVPPSGRNLPSVFHSPRTLLKLQWSRLKFYVRDFLSILILKSASPKEARWYNRKVKIHRSQIAPTAVALHQEMYSAFAEGDVKTLRNICTDGIYDSFRARIGGRVRGERVVWELTKYNKRAQVVSHRAARLPIEGAAVRQAVVRISSRQKLTRYGRNGSPVQGTGKEKDVIEYLVIQKKYWQWKAEDWQVWGTTEETKFEDVEQWQKNALGVQ